MDGLDAMNGWLAIKGAPSKILWLAEAAAGVCRHSPNLKTRAIATAADRAVLPWARRRLNRRMAAQQARIREKAR